MDLDKIERDIAGGQAIPVTGSHSSATNHIVETPNGKVFHKRYPPRDTRKREEDPERATFMRMVYTMAGPSYIANVPLEEHIVKEVATIRRWGEIGLPAPKMLHFDGDRTIILEYMTGHSLDEELEGPLNETAFAGVLDSLHDIRRAAFALGDKEVLHSDPHTGNFFRDTERGLVRPIDPAKAVKAEMSLAEADARMYLLFLSKIFKLGSGWGAQVRYVEQAVDRLTNEERTLMRDLNVDPVEQRAYFETHPLPSDNISDIYFREDIRNVVQGELGR